MIERTSFTIAAIDQATEVVRRVETSFERLQKSYLQLAGFMTAGIGVGAFMALMKSTIDAADELNKLSQKTGIAVDQLSQLKYAAELSGVNTQALAKGVKNLSVQMIEAGDATSKAARVFKAMGVDVSGGPMKTIEKIAGVFSQLEDGEMKTALATQLFGKAGMDLIPLLNQGEAGLLKLKDEAVRLGIVMSEDMTRAAEQFNDNIKAVKASSEGLGVTLLNKMAPSLVRISAAMKAAAEDGGVLNALFVGFGGALQEALGKSDVAKLQERVLQYTKEIALYEGKINEARLEGLNVEGALTKAQEERLKFLREELRLIKASEAERRFGVADQNDRRMRQGQVLTGPDAPAIRRALGAAGSGPSWFDREMAAAMAAYDVALAEIANGTDKLAASEKKLIELRKSADWAKAAPGERARLEAQLQTNTAMEKYKALAEQVAKAKRDAQEANARELEQLDRQIEALDKQVKFYGMSESAVTAAAIAELEYQKALNLANTELIDPDVFRAYDARIERLKRIRELQGQKEALDQAREYERQQLGMWSQMGDAAGNFFADLFMNGKSAFDNLKRQLKSFLAELIALVAKRWFLQLVAGVTGSAGAANAAASAGANSLAGTALSTAGNYAFGGSAAAGSAYAAGQGGYIASAAYVSGASEAAPIYGTFAGELGGALPELYSALSAIPVWGWIAMAVIAIGAWIAGRHKGGDKWGGSFFSGGSVPGSDNGRFFTPNQADAALRTQIEGLQLGYGQLATRLGGVGGQFGFGVGFDHDPAGTAQSRVSSMLTGAGGNVLYSNLDRSMDDKEVPAQIALELKRQLLVALQNTTFDEHLNHIFASITDIANASSEQIDAVLAQAIEMKNVLDTLDLWAQKGLTVEAIRAMQREGESLTATLNALAVAQGTYYSLFFTAEENHARQLGIMTRQLEVLGVAMPTTRQGFRDLVEALDLTDEAQARLYRQLLELAPSISDLLPPIENLGTAVTNVGDTISQTVKQVVFDLAQYRTTFDDAWDAYYGPEGRARRANQASLWEYLQGLRGNSPLSPLDPMQQFELTRNQFIEQSRLAQGGDVNAIGGLSSLLDRLLNQGRGVFASTSQYVDLFNWATHLAGDIARPGGGDELQRNVYAEVQKHTAIQKDILATLIAIRDQGPKVALQVADTIEQGTSKVAKAVQDGNSQLGRR